MSKCHPKMCENVCESGKSVILVTPTSPATLVTFVHFWFTFRQSQFWVGFLSELFLCVFKYRNCLPSGFFQSYNVEYTNDSLVFYVHTSLRALRINVQTQYLCCKFMHPVVLSYVHTVFAFNIVLLKLD